MSFSHLLVIFSHTIGTLNIIWISRFRWRLNRSYISSIFFYSVYLLNIFHRLLKFSVSLSPVCVDWLFWFFYLFHFFFLVIIKQSLLFCLFILLCKLIHAYTIYQIENFDHTFYRAINYRVINILQNMVIN